MNDARRAYPLFQTADIAAPESPRALLFSEASVDTVIALNRLWHSRLPRINKTSLTAVVNCACYAAEYAGVYYAVAAWTHPVARLLPQHTWLELRRFAIAPDAPKNTASRMLAWMVRDIPARFPSIEMLVSYQDKEVHTGTIYRASGWFPVTLVDPRSRPWNNSCRVRNEEQSRSPKQRWQKEIRVGGATAARPSDQKGKGGSTPTSTLFD